MREVVRAGEGVVLGQRIFKKRTGRFGFFRIELGLVAGRQHVVQFFFDGVRRNGCVIAFVGFMCIGVERNDLCAGLVHAFLLVESRCYHVMTGTMTVLICERFTGPK